VNLSLSSPLSLDKIRFLSLVIIQYDTILYHIPNNRLEHPQIQSCLTTSLLFRSRQAQLALALSALALHQENIHLLIYFSTF